jgi:hypothetical protein
MAVVIVVSPLYGQPEFLMTFASVGRTTFLWRRGVIYGAVSRLTPREASPTDVVVLPSRSAGDRLVRLLRENHVRARAMTEGRAAAYMVHAS